MRRREFCRVLGSLPVAAWVLDGGRAPAQATAPDVPKLSPLRTIEVDPNAERPEPPVLTAVALSPDGATLAAAGDDHHLRLWKVADGSEIGQWKEHNDWVRAISFHPSGKQLLTAGDDHLLKIWDVTEGKVSQTIENKTGVLHRAMYLPSGEQFVSAGFDKIVRLYETVTANVVHEFECTSDDVRALTVSPDGARLAASGRDGVIRVWNVADRKLVVEIPAHRMRIRVLAYSPDGRQFVTAGDDRKFFLWDAAGTRTATLANPPGRLMCAAFLSNDVVALGGSDNVIRVLDVATRRELQHLVGHTGSIAALDYHADSGILASSSFDTTARLWQPTGGRRTNQTTQRPTRTPVK